MERSYPRARVKCGLADLRTDQRVNCGPNLRTRFAVYLLVGPQIRVVYMSSFPVADVCIMYCVRRSVPTELHLSYWITQAKGGD